MKSFEGLIQEKKSVIADKRAYLKKCKTTSRDSCNHLNTQKMQIMDTWEWTWDMAMVPHHIHNPFHLLKNEESFSHTCTQYGLKILPNKIEEEKQS